MIKGIALIVCTTLICINSGSAADQAADNVDPNTFTPTISIIIDDLGDQLKHGKRAVLLKGALTYSFLPQTPYSVRLAEMAHELDKEVMLHLPMEATEHRKLGNGGLTMEMSQQNFINSFRDSLTSVPHVRGINNHMGSLLTQDTDRMTWLMQEIGGHDDLFFIDSRTTKNTVAQHLATEHKIPNLQRDVFLDNERDPKYLARQFRHLIKIAHKHGSAIAIAHPYPETLAFLEQQLTQLDRHGVKLVPVSSIIARKYVPNPEHSSNMLAARQPQHATPSIEETTGQPTPYHSHTN